MWGQAGGGAGAGTGAGTAAGQSSSSAGAGATGQAGAAPGQAGAAAAAAAAVAAAMGAANASKDGTAVRSELSSDSPNGTPVNAAEAAQERANAAAAAALAAQTRASEPQQIPLPTPYGASAALKDLYTQVPSTAGPVRRFGSEAFLLGTGNANQIPMDLPVGPDYVLGPGDNLTITLWGGHSDRYSVNIDRQGQIALPEAGTLNVDGLTLGQAQDQIQKILNRQFTNEHVEIALGRLRTVRIYVVGDVQRPGAYDVSSLSTPLSALYAAGGPTSGGSLRILRQFRGKNLVREIDLYDFLLRGVRSNSDRLLPGDTLVVPAVGPQVTVEGMVHRPAVYELHDEQFLSQVLDLAGGVLGTASLKQIDVERLQSYQRKTMLSLNLPDSMEGVAAALGSFKVQGGDDVVISQILPYNNEAVYLDGHVYRPGRYPFKEGMTITDLLHSYQDILPEPATRGELIRISGPDLHQETVLFSLPDVMAGNSPIPLKPFDTVRIGGRYDVDAPKVIIDGPVLRPGSYPMPQGFTVADLIRSAGGFARSAYQGEADVTTYTIQNGEKVVLKHTLVAVDKALNGDKSADLLLQPGDVISIRQISGWQDIGASVQISGEVAFAGTYGIQQGEHLSSLVARAGGFTVNAYPEGADLERTQVRELAERARQQLILRIEGTPITTRSGAQTAQEQINLQDDLKSQQQQVLNALRSTPVTGRQVVVLSSDINKWKGTAADIELRPGDTLLIPKRPSFVLVSGQVYNGTAATFAPGKRAGWYLHQAGGVTKFGEKKAIYIVRADGSVIAGGSAWSGRNVLDSKMKAGDTIVVPEKIFVESEFWRNVIASTQVVSSLAILGVAATAIK